MRLYYLPVFGENGANELKHKDKKLYSLRLTDDDKFIVGTKS